MNIQLSPENEQFLAQQLSAGAFASPSEALNAGVELLRRRDEVVAKVQRGCEQLEAGEFTEYSREGLRERFEELKKRAMSFAQQEPSDE